MNRFAAEGLLAEAAAGKRIAVVTANHRAVQDAVNEMREVLAGEPTVTVRLTNGQEEVWFQSGGRVLFWPARTATYRCRGYSLDLVFIDAGADPMLEDCVEFLPAIAARGGSIVRA